MHATRNDEKQFVSRGLQSNKYGIKSAEKTDY